MSEYTGYEAADPSAPAALVVPAFKFELGQRVVYRRDHPDDMRDVEILSRNFDGKENSYVVIIDKSISSTSSMAYGLASESDLSELTPADRTRIGVESLGWGPAREVQGGHSVSRPIDESGTESPSIEEGLPLDED